MKIKGKVKCATRGCKEILFRPKGVYKGKPRCFVHQREQARKRALRWSRKHSKTYPLGLTNVKY